MTMTWEHGRQLASLQTEDNKVNYKYDSNGMRTQKSDSNGTTYYYYDSNNNLIGLTKGNDTLLFYYDSDGNVTSFTYNGTMYYYIKNLQSDVVKIINQSGTVCASYVYDAWGNIQSESGEPNIRRLNPFRYRGYVYDEETGLYYLQSRYYDPLSGRFLNADVYCDTQSGSPLSTNMFAYCENNSIRYVDYSGKALSTKAITYAQKYWNSRNPNYYYYNRGDCANFVSQCLYAGGFSNMTGKWYSYKNKNKWNVSESWRLVKKLMQWLMNSCHYSAHTFSSKKSLLNYKKNIHVGDVAFISTGYNGSVSHAILIGRITKNNIYYYAHTSSRDARKNGNGLVEYFDKAPKNKKGTVIIFNISKL